jgi:hypothetical protein
MTLFIQSEAPEVTAFRGQGLGGMDNRDDLLLGIRTEKPADGPLVSKFQEPFDDIGFMVAAVEGTGVDVPEKSAHVLNSH